MEARKIDAYNSCLLNSATKINISSIKISQKI